MGKKGSRLIGARLMFLRKNYDGLESFVWEGTGRTIGTLFPAQLSPCDPPTIEPTPKWDEQSALAKEFWGGVKRAYIVGCGSLFQKIMEQTSLSGSLDMDIASNTLETLET